MAAKVKVTWQGVTELMKTLQAAGVAIDDRNPEVKSVILPSAGAAMDNARSLAPLGTRTVVSGKKKYPPGSLRKSLIATPGPSKQRGVFMVARKRVAPYAVYVEFGTSKMRAQPFFRPALLQFGSTYAESIAPGIKGLIEAAAAKAAYHPSE